MVPVLYPYQENIPDNCPIQVHRKDAEKHEQKGGQHVRLNHDHGPEDKETTDEQAAATDQGVASRETLLQALRQNRAQWHPHNS